MTATPAATSLTLDAEYAPSAVQDVFGSGSLELVLVVSGDTLSPIKVNGGPSRRAIETNEDISASADVPSVRMSDVWDVILRIGAPGDDPNDCLGLRNVRVTMRNGDSVVGVWEHDRPFRLQYSEAGENGCRESARSVRLMPGVVG